MTSPGSPGDDYFALPSLDLPERTPEQIENAARWDAYFDPDYGVLKNRLGLKFDHDLDVAEYALTAVGEAEILSGEIELDGDTIGEKLCSAHRHLFGEIYEWAGEFRDIDLMKNGNQFGAVSDMDELINQAQRTVESMDWENTSFERKVEALGELHADLNHAHPFREGNGRATRLTMKLLAAEHGVALDFNAVDPDRWNTSSADSFLDPEGVWIDPRPFVEIYTEVATERTTSGPLLESADVYEVAATSLLDRLGMSTSAVAGLADARHAPAAGQGNTVASPERTNDSAAEL